LSGHSPATTTPEPSYRTQWATSPGMVRAHRGHLTP